MPCYPCTHCNKCGIYSIRLEITCATCGADVVIGKKECPNCGSSYRNNIKRGMMGKPKGTKDYYTRLEASQGGDAHRMIDMSKFGNRGSRIPGQPMVPGAPKKPLEKKSPEKKGPGNRS